MCVEPCILPEVGPVACRNCWQCRENRVNDLVGRCIAEQQTATVARAVTLTYSDDLNPGTEYRAATLIYKDFQDFMKRLRKAGYKVRYIVAGEYGSNNGRAHWHAVLFFYGKAPQCVAPWEVKKSLLENTPNLSAPKYTTKICEEARFYWKHWPHGVVYFEKPEYEGFRYVMKYALKNQKLEITENRLAMSKKPPLGYKFFVDRAHEYARQGLSPQSPEYDFRHSFDRYTGKRRKYWLQGRMREIFIGEYLAAYEEQHGMEYPLSEFIEQMEDKWIREGADYEMTIDQWREKLDENRMSETRAAASAMRSHYENEYLDRLKDELGDGYIRYGEYYLYRNMRGEVQEWHVKEDGDRQRAEQAFKECEMRKEQDITGE